jgi:hypothetical protein
MDRNTEGRIPIEVIEIDLPYCLNEYGDSNCLAVLSDTGDQHKCFNTLGSVARSRIILIQKTRHTDFAQTKLKYLWVKFIFLFYRMPLLNLLK